MNREDSIGSSQTPPGHLSHCIRARVPEIRFSKKEPAAYIPAPTSSPSLDTVSYLVAVNGSFALLPGRKGRVLTHQPIQHNSPCQFPESTRKRNPVHIQPLRRTPSLDSASDPVAVHGLVPPSARKNRQSTYVPILSQLITYTHHQPQNSSGKTEHPRAYEERKKTSTNKVLDSAVDSPNNKHPRYWDIY